MEAIMPRVKAVVWDFFTVREESDKFASCNACNDSISREGSSVKSYNTTNLIDHLKKKHTEECSQYLEKKKIRDFKEQEKQKEQAAFKQLNMVETRAKVKVQDMND